MKAYGDHIIVILRETKRITEGGIHLPDNASEHNIVFGDVVSVGSTVANKDELKDRCVAFKKYSSDGVEYENETYAVLPYSEVLFTT